MWVPRAKFVAFFIVVTQSLGDPMLAASPRQSISGGEGWSQSYAIKAPQLAQASGSEFGFSAAVEASFLSVGAPGTQIIPDNVTSPTFPVDNPGVLKFSQWNPSRTAAANTWGAVFVFGLDAFSPEAILVNPFGVITANPTYSLFGYSVAAYGDKLVVGNPDDDRDYLDIINAQAPNATIPAAVPVAGKQETIGAAWVYRRFPSGDWTVEAYLKPIVDLSASDDTINQHFGYSVAMTANRVVVGAPDDQVNNTGVLLPVTQPPLAASKIGAAYVCDFDGSNWTYTSYLKPPTVVSAGFGKSVTAHGDHVFVGAPDDVSSATAGEVYRFSCQLNLLCATGPTPLDFGPNGPTAGDSCGRSIDASNETLVVGCPGDSLGVTQVFRVEDKPSLASSQPFLGAAYTFTFNSTNWNPEYYLKPAYSQFAFEFGTSVHVRNDVLAVGGGNDMTLANGVNNFEGFSGQPLAASSSIGAVHLYHGPNRTRVAYMKPPNAFIDASFEFGAAMGTADTPAPIAISRSNEVYIGAFRETSFAASQPGPDFFPTNVSGSGVGALYAFAFGTVECNGIPISADILGAGAKCFNSSLIFDGETTIDVSIVIGTIELVVIGDLVLTGDSILVFDSGNFTTLVIEGCVSFGGELDIEIDQSDLSQDGLTLQLLAFECIGTGTSFDEVIVAVNGDSDCQPVVSEEYTPTSFTVLIFPGPGCDRSGSDDSLGMGGITGIVIGVLVACAMCLCLLFVILAVLVFAVVVPASIVLASVFKYKAAESAVHWGSVSDNSLDALEFGGGSSDEANILDARTSE